MMEVLRPGYSGQSPADLSGKFLEEASSNVNDLIKKETQGHITNSFTVGRVFFLTLVENFLPEPSNEANAFLSCFLLSIVCVCGGGSVIYCRIIEH